MNPPTSGRGDQENPGSARSHRHQLESVESFEIRLSKREVSSEGCWGDNMTASGQGVSKGGPWALWTLKVVLQPQHASDGGAMGRGRGTAVPPYSLGPLWLRALTVGPEAGCCLLRAACCCLKLSSAPSLQLSNLQALLYIWRV